MLTPCFDIEQNEQFVTVAIRVPFAKLSEAEFFIDGCSFKFYCKPYFLRLCLPGELVENGMEKAIYDVNKGIVTVHLPKLHAGEYFNNLGMLTTLLSKKPAGNKMTAKPLIEVMTGTSEDGASASGFKTPATEQGEEEEEEFDWQVDQLLPEEHSEAQNMQISSYGFADQRRGVFGKLQHEIPSIVDCPDPDHMTCHERRVARIAHEEASFNPEHYLADLMDNPMIDTLCQFQPPWEEQLATWKALTSVSGEEASKPLPMEPDHDIVPFTDAERHQLKELPNKEYLLDKATRRSLYLGLIDIIFAYAYNYRTTEGENSVESAWTICKLSSTLSWLEVFQGGAQEVIYCSLRRSLCYPLYRHWKLAQHVLQDTRELFHLGRRKLLQCLISVYQILNSSDPYYMMNVLYITDYCIWIQRASAKQIQKLAKELDQVSLDKSTIGWELEELEQAAHLVAAEDTEEEGEGAESGSEQDVPSDTSEGGSLEESSEQKQSVEFGKDHDGKQSVSSPVEEQGVQEHAQQTLVMAGNAALSSATGSSTVSDDGIAKLSHGLETLLTLNPSSQKYSKTKQRLIEEL